MIVRIQNTMDMMKVAVPDFKGKHGIMPEGDAFDLWFSGVTFDLLKLKLVRAPRRNFLMEYCDYSGFVKHSFFLWCLAGTLKKICIGDPENKAAPLLWFLVKKPVESVHNFFLWFNVEINIEIDDW